MNVFDSIQANFVAACEYLKATNHSLAHTPFRGNLTGEASIHQISLHLLSV